MDWGVGSGPATVVAVSDGTASVYLSNGGGYLGGGQAHESIRKAAQQAVSVAADALPATHQTTDFPLPQRGEVMFYLLTDAGVFTASALETEMGGHKHALSKLGNAMQEIITEYRRTQ